MTRIHNHIGPYLRVLVDEAATKGLPMQRPLFLHDDDDTTYMIHDHYLLGRDLLVAPVHRDGARTWRVYLPQGGAWIHVWSGARSEGGQHVVVDAPIGRPPLFEREGSLFHDLFAALTAF